MIFFWTAPEGPLYPLLATLEVDNVSSHPIVVSATLNRLLNMKAEGHILISESAVKLGKFDKIMPNKKGGCSVPAIQ
jgi:hypothetical protein